MAIDINGWNRRCPSDSRTQGDLRKAEFPIKRAERLDTRKQRPRLFLIALDLGNERIEAVEFQLGAEITKEGDGAELAVEIAAEIER